MFVDMEPKDEEFIFYFGMNYSYSSDNRQH